MKKLKTCNNFDDKSHLERDLRQCGDDNENKRLGRENIEEIKMLLRD